MMSRLKVSRLTAACVAACWMMSVGAASGQGLPASVSDPYARYQTAQAAGDTQVAEQAAGWPLDARYAVTYSHGAAAAFQFEAYEDAATAYLIASDLLFAEGADPVIVWNARAYSRLSELIAWAGDETALDERLAGDVIFQQMAERHADATAALEGAEVWSRPGFVDAVLEERVSPACPETTGSDEPQGFVLARFTVRAGGSTMR